MAGQEASKNMQKKRKFDALDDSKRQSRSERKNIHMCKYCNKDISNAVRIKCAVCASFQLCLDCFCVGVEIQQHKKDHAYRVHGDLSFPLYELSWGADEEMLLMEGIDASGLGNWSAVSAHVGSKTAAQCKDHYFDIYVRSIDFPLPHPKPEMQDVDPLQVAKELEVKAEEAGGVEPSEALEAGSAVREDDSLAAEDKSGGNLQGALRPSGIADVAMVDQGSGGVEAAESLQPADSKTSVEEGGMAAAPPPKKVRPGKSDSGKTKPGGGQEEKAGDPMQQTSTRGLPSTRAAAAGEPGATMGKVIGGIQTEHTRVGGLQYEMTGFHGKRSEFDHEYDNDAELLISELDFPPTDTQEERDEKVHLVEIYNQRLTEREHRRAEVIARGLLDIKRSQAVERRQSQAERDLHAQMRVFARYQPTVEHDRMLDGLLLEQRLRQRLQELKELRAGGVRNLEEAEEFEMQRRKRTAESAPSSKANDRSQRYMARTGTDDSSVMSQAMMATLGSAEAGGRTRELSRLRTNTSSPLLSKMAAFGSGKEGGNTAAQLAGWRSRRGVGLDITPLPAADTLTSKERLLCATERLLPHQYLAYKASLLREAERAGGTFPRSKAKHMFRLKATSCLRVYDLLVASGWLAPSQPLPAETSGQEEVSGMEGATASPANSNSKES